MTITTQALTREKGPATYATKTLTVAAAVWFMAAIAGLWLFGLYIVVFYGKTTFSGHPEAWNKVLATGYIKGDWKGNLAVGLHVLLAAILVVGGPLQLVPQLRRYVPALHRWLGRTYVATAIIGSITGAIMLWTRGTVGDSIQHISNSIQVIYIIIFGSLAVRYARCGQFEPHRKWALRLFMVTNGVWFFRLGLMAWLVLNGGPVGFDPATFTGPFLSALSVFTYAIPVSLLVLELYFYAQRKQNSAFSFLTAGIIILCTVIMSIGIFGAAMGMWLPRL